MIENFARTGIYDKFETVCTVPLITLKGHRKPVYPDWYIYFFDRADRYGVYGKGVAPMVLRSPSNSVIRKCLGFFSRNGAEIGQLYIDSHFGGSWETAMKETETFNSFMDGFNDFFEERRRLFMEKTDALIQQEAGNMAERKSRFPQSHGGVANLLKVLTKTMQEQGSSIRTIAKVQYAVCLQAGIHIPEEFITDVLVVADMNPSIWDADAKNREKIGAKQ